VNIFDINAISAGWSHAPGSAAAAVPEPSAWMLLVAALSGLALWQCARLRRTLHAGDLFTRDAPQLRIP